MTSSRGTATRRKAPQERRTEILEAASAVAVTEGLEKVTAKRVAQALGVFPGLISHYFASADDLVAAAFGCAATAERREVFELVGATSDPIERMRRLLGAWLQPERDAMSLLWLDAWQASRRRPALRDEIAAQMDLDLKLLTDLIVTGIGRGDFTVEEDAATAAMCILALIDGLSIQSATRASHDYTPITLMVLRTTEQQLGLHHAQLQPR